MKRNVIVLLTVLLLALLTGCGKTPDNTKAAGDKAVAAESEKNGDKGAENLSTGRYLLNVTQGVTLAFVEPQAKWKILMVLPNEEKTSYAAVIKVYKSEEDSISDSRIELQFFKEDGSLISHVQTSVYAWSDINEKDFLFKGDSFRFDRALQADYGDTVLYCNAATGEMETLVGRVLCSDKGYDFVGDDRSYEYREFVLVRNFKVVSSVKMKVNDDNYIENEENPQYRLDVETRVATIAGKNIRYLLDFNRKSYGIERFYADSDLKEKLGESADGKTEVYLACPGGAGDAFWYQIVKKDKESGRYSFIAYTYNPIGCILGADDIIFCNEISEIKLYDINSGEEVKSFFKFGFEFPSNSDANEFIVLAGSYYDKEKEQYVFAFRKSNGDVLNDVKTPVAIYLYDAEGNLKKEIVTNYTTYPYADKIFTRQIKISKNSDGSYTLDTELDNEKIMIIP